MVHRVVLALRRARALTGARTLECSVYGKRGWWGSGGKGRRRVVVVVVVVVMVVRVSVRGVVVVGKRRRWRLRRRLWRLMRRGGL